MDVLQPVLKTVKLNCNNKYPKSPLPNSKKILEKLIYNRITKFLNDNNLIYPLQFSF